MSYTSQFYRKKYHRGFHKDIAKDKTKIIDPERLELVAESRPSL